MAKLTEVIEGLTILEKYEPGSHNVSAAHDVIYAGPGEEIVEGTYEEDDGPRGTVVSADDAKRLRELGWHISSECDSWARFV